MCGICGIIGEADLRVIHRMTDAMAHRGPDDRGIYVGDNVFLGQRRLAVIDTSTRGNQPMCNEDRSLWLVYNGEIYNFRELRQELVRLGHVFRSETDSEIILHSYEEYGEDCLERFNGDFSFALWDQKSKRVTLARDRLGIKPLYYMSYNEKFYFASETKSFLEVPGFQPEVNLKCLDLYFSFRYVTHTDETMLRGIRRLPPAHLLVFEKGRLKIRRYWSIPRYIEKDRHRDGSKSVIETFRMLMEESVEMRLMSDVPMGVLLSGGLDSSCVLGIMARLTSEKIKTFSIGFNSDLDELRWARKVARYFGTDHEEVRVEAKDLYLLERVVALLDEPVGDAIILPMYLISRKASESVKVVLTGEGADEILGGYIHHLTMHYGERIKHRLPMLLSGLFRQFVTCVPIEMLDHFFFYPAFLGRQGKTKLIYYLDRTKNLFESYYTLTSLFSEREKEELYSPDLRAALGSMDFGRFPLANEMCVSSASTLNRIIRHDLQTWLPDQILMKLDRITMANSLEGRVPFLDHRIVEFTSTLGDEYKIGQGKTKMLLRQAYRGVLPSDVLRRRKSPFFIPMEACFQERLFDFVEDTLTFESTQKRGYFRYETIKRFIDRHRKFPKELLYSKQILALTIFELWHRSVIDRAT